MIENPAYLYGSYELPSPVDGALFHYTKLESFMKIIETMTLRSSPLCKMNDLNEASIDSLDWNTDFLMMIQAQKYIKELCSIICFTKNYMTGPICEEGSNHPALWAHYAEDSNGVCIVLDKEALLEINKKQLTKLFYKIEPVDYSIHLAPDDEIIKKSYDDVKDFVRSNYRGLFFRKHTDWSYEREERFFVEAPEVYLNIKGAIKYIILGGRLKNKESSLRQIIEQMITPGTLSYKYFNMHSFAEMTPSVNGYLTVDAAHVFYMQLQKMAMASSLAADWLRWHMESFYMRCGANPFAAARCAWGARDFDWAALQQCHSEVIGNNSVWEIPEHIRSVEKGCHQNLNSGFAEQPVIKSQGINYGESQDCK